MTTPNIPHVRNAPPKPVEVLQRNDPRLWSNGATICDMFLVYGKCPRPVCIREHRPQLTNWNGSLKRSDKAPYCYDHYSLKAGCRRTPNCPLMHGDAQLPDYRDPSTWECQKIGAMLRKADTEATQPIRPKRHATSPKLKTQDVEHSEDHSISVGNGTNVINTTRQLEERKFVKYRAKPSTRVRDMADEQQHKPLDPFAASGFGNTDAHVDGLSGHDKDTESTGKSEKETVSDSKIDGAMNQEVMAVEPRKAPIPRKRPPLPSKQLYIPPRRRLTAERPSVYYPEGSGIHLSRPPDMKRTSKNCSSTKNLPSDESAVGSREMVRGSSISRTQADATIPETLVVRPVPLDISPSTTHASQSFDDTTTHQTSAEEPKQVLPPGEDTAANKNDVISILHTPLPEPLKLAPNSCAALATYLQSPLPSVMVDGVENSWNVARVEHPIQSQSLAPIAPNGLAHGRSPTINSNFEQFYARDSALFNNASPHDLTDHPPSIPTPRTSPNRFLTDSSSVPTNSEDNQLYTRSPPLPTPPSSVDGIMTPRPSRDEIEGTDEPEKKPIKDGADVDEDSFGAQMDIIDDMKMRLRSSRHSSVSSFHEAPIRSSRARVSSPFFSPNLINGAEPQQPSIHQTRLAQQPHAHQTRIAQQEFPSTPIQHHTAHVSPHQYVNSTANIPQSHNISSPSPGHTAHPRLHQNPHVSRFQAAEIPSSPYPGYRLPHPDEWNAHVCFSCFRHGHDSGFCFYRTKCSSVMDKELLRSQRGVFSRFWTKHILFVQHNHKVHPTTIQAHMHLLRVMQQGDQPDPQLLRPLFFVPTLGPSNGVAHVAPLSVGTSAQSLPLMPNGNVQSPSMQPVLQNSATIPGIFGTICNEPMNHNLPPHLRRKGITQPLYSHSSVVHELSERCAVKTPSVYSPQSSSSGGVEDKETLIQNPPINPVLEVQKSTHEETMPVDISAGVLQPSQLSDPRAANVQEAQDLSRQASMSVNQSQLSQRINSASCSAENGVLVVDGGINTSFNNIDENSKALKQQNGQSKCGEDKFIAPVTNPATCSSKTRIQAPRESHETSLPVEQSGQSKGKQPAHTPYNQNFLRKISSETTGTFENLASGIYQSHRRESFNPTGQIDQSEKSPQIQLSREPSTPPRQPIRASSSVSSVKQFSPSSSDASTSAHRLPASTTCWLCNKAHSGECNVSAYTVGRISNASPLPDWDPKLPASSPDASELECPDSLEPARPESPELEITFGNDFVYKAVNFPRLSGNQYAFREGAVYRYDQINHLEIVDVRKKNEHLNRLIMEANVAQERREFQESDSFHLQRKVQKKKAFFHWLPAEILIQIFQEVAGESEVLEKVDRIVCDRLGCKKVSDFNKKMHYNLRGVLGSCTRFRPLAEPILYKIVKLKTHRQITRFVSTINNRPELALIVRKIHIENETLGLPDRAFQRYGMRDMCSLDHRRIPIQELAANIARILEICPNLVALSGRVFGGLRGIGSVWVPGTGMKINNALRDLVLSDEVHTGAVVVRFWDTIRSFRNLRKLVIKGGVANKYEDFASLLTPVPRWMRLPPKLHDTAFELLKTIDFTASAEITDRTLELIAPRLKSLRHLAIRNCKLVTTAGFMAGLLLLPPSATLETIHWSLSEDCYKKPYSAELERPWQKEGHFCKVIRKFNQSVRDIVLYTDTVCHEMVEELEAPNLRRFHLNYLRWKHCGGDKDYKRAQKMLEKAWKQSCESEGLPWLSFDPAKGWQITGR